MGLMFVSIAYNANQVEDKEVQVWKWYFIYLIQFNGKYMNSIEKLHKGHNFSNNLPLALV